MAEFIHFNYPDQTDFTVANNNNNFDCEAFIYKNDSLHLFSKNWVNQKTRYYILPTDTGFFTAFLKDSFNVNGLITGAAMNENEHLILIGYNKIGACFSWLLYDFPNNHFFEGNKRRINLPHALSLGQIEGVVFSDTYSGFISAEGFMGSQARLHHFDFTDFLERDSELTDFQVLLEDKEINSSKVQPNPTRENILIKITDNECSKTTFKLVDFKGKIIMEGDFEEREHRIDLNFLAFGKYLLHLTNCTREEVHHLLINQK